MPTITIYTTTYCPYCDRAKALFEKLKVPYSEIDVGEDADLRLEMIHKAEGRRTVPQIFINDQPIGGCDDLYVLHRTGKLKKLLSQ